MVTKESIKNAFAEFVGTFLVVFVSCYSISMANLGKLDILGVALANSLVFVGVSWALQEAGPSLMNPALTLVHMINRSSKVGRGMANIASQIIGSCVATVIAACVVPDEHKEVTGSLVGYPTLNLVDYSEFQLFIFEFLSASLLTLAYFATIKDKRGPAYVYGFAIGSVVLVSTVMFFKATGGCTNVVRVIGPQIIFGDWNHIPIYWLATGFGSLFAAYYYEYFILKDSEVEEDLEDINHGRTMKTIENINQAATLRY
jgi:aquaporin Z